MQSIVEELAEKNVEVVAISADSVSELDRLVEKKGFTFTILSDPNLKVIDKFGLRHEDGNPIKKSDIARPAMFIMDERSDILWTGYPDSWRIRPTAENVLDQVNELFNTTYSSPIIKAIPR